MQAEADPNQAQDSQAEQFNPNSVFGTLIVALALCLVCSLVVSTAAVALRPLQDANQKNKIRRNVLIAAGLWDKDKNDDADIPGLFKNIEPVMINLSKVEPDDPAAGTINNEVDPDNYNARKAAKDPADSITLSAESDVAGIKRRENVAPVYLVRDDAGALKTIVLPIYGKGLWSTLYGFLALEADTRHVRGITYYEHGETPGLGAEVQNPKWVAQWPGKEVLDEQGTPILDVIKPGNTPADYQVDGISGATITSNGVENMIRFWLGPDGFGPFLQRVRNGEFATRQ